MRSRLVGQEDQQGRWLKEASWQEMVGTIKQSAEEHDHIEAQQKTSAEAAEVSI